MFEGEILLNKSKQSASHYRKEKRVRYMNHEFNEK